MSNQTARVSFEVICEDLTEGEIASLLQEGKARYAGGGSDWNGDLPPVPGGWRVAYYRDEKGHLRAYGAGWSRTLYLRG